MEALRSLNGYCKMFFDPRWGMSNCFQIGKGRINSAASGIGAFFICRGSRFVEAMMTVVATLTQ